MGALLTAVIPSLLPAAADGLRGLLSRFSKGAGAKPANIAEVVQLEELDLKRLELLARLDAPAANVYAWVSSARALQRPALATWILLAYTVGLFLELDASVMDRLADAATMVTFYLFGDHGYSALKARR